MPLPADDPSLYAREVKGLTNLDEVDTSSAVAQLQIHYDRESSGWRTGALSNVLPLVALETLSIILR